MRKAWSADKIFTGSEWSLKSAVIVEENQVTDILPLDNLPEDVSIIQHAEILAPAFIDIQIYGASSKLFSVYPSTDTLEKMREHCLIGGTKYFLPTIATNEPGVFKKGIDAIREYGKKGGTGAIGLHVEGPWINMKKRGAHLEKFIHSPEINEIRELVEYGKGVIKIITLAPEVCSKEIINFISSNGIIVSAGHSNGTFNEINEAFENGIHLATHLFNAMSPMHHRQPGFPAAILLHSSVMASVVADGYHVDFAMIKLAKKLMGERLFLITDAVTETKEGPYQHELVGDKYESHGILSGSTLTIIKAIKNCVEKCDIPLEETLRMGSLYPARALGIEDKTGKIEKGFRADFVLMDGKFNVINCI
jgi:N-acetylglucosamine-6-phosphate deacetylase